MSNKSSHGPPSPQRETGRSAAGRTTSYPRLGYAVPPNAQRSAPAQPSARPGAGTVHEAGPEQVPRACYLEAATDAPPAQDAPIPKGPPMLKRFFYASAAVLMLALAYHLGAGTATAQAPGNPVVGISQYGGQNN